MGGGRNEVEVAFFWCKGEKRVLLLLCNHKSGLHSCNIFTIQPAGFLTTLDHVGICEVLVCLIVITTEMERVAELLGGVDRRLSLTDLFQ